MAKQKHAKKGIKGKMKRLRLHRLQRIYLDHPIYFVTMNVARRQFLLNHHLIHQHIEKFGAEGLSKGCYLGRYILMPDHLHAFVTFGQQDVSTTTSLSLWVKALKGSISRIWRNQGIIDGQWQKGFFDHILRSSESYSSKWLYVAQNPVRKRYVEKSEDWPYQGEICRLEVR